MHRTTLAEWCKEAGPIGPALWAFDNLVETLASIPEQTPDVVATHENDDNGTSFGIIIFSAIGGGLLLSLALILFFPH
jgi:hypothetical protein